MAHRLAVLLFILGVLALVAACNDEGDFLLDESEPEGSGTPSFFQRTPQPSPEPSPSATLEAEVTPGVCGETYVVEPGDYPLKIAERCGVASEDAREWVDELLRMNDIDDPTALRVGQELEVPQ